MIVSFDKLPQHVSERLDPLYFITGNELLLEEESFGLIVAEAKARGFAEVVHVEIAQIEEWNSLLTDASGRSLFADRRLFDIRLTRNAFSPKVHSALEEWIQSNDENTIIVLRGWAWEYRFRTTAWFKAISSLATTVILETVPSAKVTQWIKDRANTLGLNLKQDAVEELSDLTDGNLYAAQQELEKLRLIFMNDNTPIGTEELTRIDWSISGTFDIVDAACSGNISKLTSMLSAVQRAGTQPLFLVGALTSQLRRFHDLACDRRTYLSQNRRRLGEAVIRRIGRAGLESLLVECAQIDSQQKGVLRGDSWLALESLLLNLAGYRNRTLATDADRLRIDYEV